ncbi:PKD domain-containing protein [Albibacillus kandeliae]|uniref:PKD domain-containing protein n=1 Tax=Albibacillus kandeliae TaxID=2174228 RepID=UPI000D69F4F5|nr:PKD domain-containing protein [Albibacillus kandeliae]
MARLLLTAVSPVSGTVSIYMDETSLKAAPDTVRFWAVPEGEPYGILGPQDTPYDARLHRLLFLWDFGDEGATFDKPERLLAAWRNANVARGPFVKHVYKQPGTYTIQCMVIDQLTGEYFMAEAREKTVYDADTIFPGSQTICVNPVGDSDFTGAPAGHVPANADLINEAFISTYEPVDKTTTPIRFLFKRGAEFTSDMFMDDDAPYLLSLGAYGSGDRPKMNAKTDTDDAAEIWARAIYFYGRYGGLGGAFIPEVRIYGLNFVGNFDPTTTAVAPRDSPDLDGISVNAILIQKYTDMLIDDCTFKGFQRSTIGFNVGGFAGKVHCHVNDCLFEDFGGEYPFIGGASEHQYSSLGFSGCGMAENVDAPTTYLTYDNTVPGYPDFAGGASKALIRYDHGQNQYIAACDFFHLDWRQPCIKVQNSPKAGGSICNVHSCVMEFGYYLIDIGGNAGNGIGSGAHNIVVDGVRGLGAYSTRGAVLAGLSGLTVRNMSAVIPAVQYYANDTWAFVVGRVLDDGGVAVPEAELDAPIEIYSCTFGFMRTKAQQWSGGPDTVPFYRAEATGEGEFTNVVIANNLEHQPNMPIPITTYDPVTSTELWPPRCKGQRDPANFVLDDSFETPAGSWIEMVPEEESAANGAASGELIAYDDVLGVVRGSTASIGALEPA